MSYIYFGSNWENNNILDVFVKYNIVFAGLSEERKKVLIIIKSLVLVLK